MSDNWVVQNLENALNTWNEKAGGDMDDHHPIAGEF